MAWKRNQNCKKNSRSWAPGTSVWAILSETPWTRKPPKSGPPGPMAMEPRPGVCIRMPGSRKAVCRSLEPEAIQHQSLKANSKMKRHLTARMKRSGGQSLVETALMLPLLLLLVLNVVNLAYFFLVTVNLTGAARSATLYSIEGAYTPYASSQPASGSSNCSTSPNTVACLVLQDLTGAL